MPERALGRRRPSDNIHQERYPLTASTTPRKPTPVVIGSNWYIGFDEPTPYANGRGGAAHWIGRTPEAYGVVRGGHAYCLLPPRLMDTMGWYLYYDQGEEGECVVYAAMRMMSLLNRTRYDPRPAYAWAQTNDEFEDTPPGDGTSVRAGLDFLRKVGPYRAGQSVPTPEHGIRENRWCSSVQQIADCLDPASGGARVLNAGCVVMLNSWGADYPHYTRMSLETLERLVVQEDGEATLVVDK